MGSESKKINASFFIILILSLISMPPIQACVSCDQQHPPNHHPGQPKIPPHPHPHPPSKKHPPHHGGHPPGHGQMPPIIVKPPPVIGTPPINNPPVSPPSGGGGGVPGLNPPPKTPQPTCPINALKLGLCVDLIGGLVHVGLGNPVENVCCPVLKGLLELEAAVCICTTIRLKLLNLNIFIPLALQVLITCGLTPPPGFVCPPLV